MSSRIIKLEGEDPRLRRTRVFVHDIIALSPTIEDCEKVMKAYPKLTLDDLRAAYEYYEVHKEEIHQAIEDDIPFGIGSDDE